MALDDSYLLVFMSLHSPLSYWIWLTCVTRLRHKRHWTFWLAPSWVICPWESQLPCWEDTQAVLWSVSHGKELKAFCPPSALPCRHVSKAPWKQIVQPQSGLYMTTAVLIYWLQACERFWARTTLLSHFWIFVLTV